MLACAVIVLAQAIYVMLGFGAGLVALGFLVLARLDVPDVVIVLLLVSLPSEGFVMAASWRDIAWSQALRVCVGVALGTLVGTSLLRTSAPLLMLQTIAVLLVLFGVGSLWSARSTLVVRWPRWTQLPVGVSSGVLAGWLGVGGPPLVIYYRLAGVSKASFRSNLMAAFLASTIVRLAATPYAGLLTVPRLTSAACVLPAALLGMWLGRCWHARISEAAFRTLVSLALIATGAALLLC